MDKKSEVGLRKLEFIAETEQNNCPDAERFAEKLNRHEGEDGQPFGCSPRTLARDIRELISQYHAPLEYDAQNRGCRLRDSSWSFDHPFFEGGFTVMSMPGTQLAPDILPEPVDANDILQLIRSRRTRRPGVYLTKKGIKINRQDILFRNNSDLAAAALKEWIFLKEDSEQC